MGIVTVVVYAASSLCSAPASRHAASRIGVIFGRPFTK
jgi:hypothetical protein